MRTTLTIDDDVLAAAKALAENEEKTVGEIISALARERYVPLAHLEKRAMAFPCCGSIPTHGASPLSWCISCVRICVTRFLHDLNVLIALIDPAHVLHDKANDWFARFGEKAWATCPLAENGVMRIVGHTRYPNSPGTPAAVPEVMTTFLAHRGHEFWPDGVTLLHREHVHAERLLDSAQVTDTYLLALAATRGGRLATFDRQLVTTAVPHGSQALHLIA